MHENLNMEKQNLDKIFHATKSNVLHFGIMFNFVLCDMGILISMHALSTKLELDVVSCQ